MNLGMPEMIFIFLLALIIFGPKKLPEIGRQIGKALAEFKRASNEFKMQIEDEIRQLEYDEAQKRAQAATNTPPTLEGNVASYQSEASAETETVGSHVAAESASPDPVRPDGTVAYDHSSYGSEPPVHSDNGSEHTLTPTQGSDVQ